MRRRTRATPFLSPTGLSVAVMVLLGVCGAVEVASGWTTHRALTVTAAAWEGDFYWEDAQLEGLQARADLLGVVYLVAFLACAVTFLVWWHTVYANLRALGAAPSTTPAWAVGWFLIPIANLFKPFGLAKEIWGGSGRLRTRTRRRGVSTAESSGILIGWWFLWIGKLVGDALANRISASAERILTDPFVTGDLTTALRRAASAQLVAGLIGAAAAGMAIFAVRAMTARQQARWEQMQLELTAEPEA